MSEASLRIAWTLYGDIWLAEKFHAAQYRMVSQGGSEVLDYCPFFNNFMMANRMALCTAVGMKMKRTALAESSLFSTVP